MAILTQWYNFFLFLNSFSVRVDKLMCAMTWNKCSVWYFGAEEKFFVDFIKYRELSGMYISANWVFKTRKLGSVPPYIVSFGQMLIIFFFLFLFLGCLLDPPSAPPDVPPRNPTMSRMNGRVTGNPSDLGVDFEPSCLVRTPSGNVYIPSGNLSKSQRI